MLVVWWYDGRIVRVWQGSGGSDSCCKDGNSDCSMIAVFKCVLGGGGDAASGAGGIVVAVVMVMIGYWWWWWW